MIRFDILTIFPEVITAYTNESIIKRAVAKGAIEINVHNIRDYTNDKHHTVDDKIYGGGPGMLMKIEPLYAAITKIKSEIPANFNGQVKVGLTSPNGDLFTQNYASSVAKEKKDQAFILICGHYEGIDYRIHEFIDFSFSIGPIVLTGGELPSLLFVDAITRLLPGVLGNDASSENDTMFTVTNNMINVVGEYPQYTRPEVFTFTDEKGQTRMLSVPPILTSGNHKEIANENESKKVVKDIDMNRA